MKFEFDDPPNPFRSPSQTARVWTETWVRDWAFCPNCGASSIRKYENNRPVADFTCSSCGEDYELKSQKSRFGPRVTDGAFRTMCERLAADDNPNLMLLSYNLNRRALTDLFVVPKHFFVREIIEERKPLAATARRAGWIGCNILLNQVPEAGKIHMVRGGVEVPRDEVLAKWQQTLFLRNAGTDSRGWLIEVMKCVEAVGRPNFTLDDVYAFESHLSAIYPDNRHVKPKIRQQLQVLRDQGYLDFLGHGHYRLKTAGWPR